MAIELTESAAKRGYTLEDATYAIENSYVTRPNFEPSRIPGKPPVWFWLGPSRDALNPIVEIFAEVTPPAEVRIFHMMPMREQFRDLLDEER